MASMVVTWWTVAFCAVVEVVSVYSIEQDIWIVVAFWVSNLAKFVVIVNHED